MNLLGLNISLNRTSKPQTQKSADTLSPAALAWLRGEDIHTLVQPSLSNAYEQVVWVYRAVNAIAEQIASIPFVFSHGERGRESLITSGPLIDFYSHPHPHINAYQYWELRILWLLLRGESIRVPVFESSPLAAPERSVAGLAAPKPSAGGPAPRITHHASPHPHSALKSVLLLDPSRFHHIIQDHRLVGWRYNAPKNDPLDSNVFLPEELWFDRLPNPFDFWRGLSPLFVAGLAAKTDFAAATFMHGLMENNADAGLIVRSDQPLTDEQREQIITTLKNRRCNPGDLNHSLFLWGANEVLAPRLSSADLQFLENRKLSRAEICAAFGVPEEIVTTTDHSKYDVMQGARLNFIENRIAPLCARLEAMEAVTVKAIDPTAVGWFDLDALPIMQQARRNRLAAAKTGFDMGIPFNELNRVLDLGFKPLPWGDTGYLPATYAPLPTARAAADGTAPGPGAADRSAAVLSAGPAGVSPALPVDRTSPASAVNTTDVPGQPSALPFEGTEFGKEVSPALAPQPHAPATEKPNLAPIAFETVRALHEIICGPNTSAPPPNPHHEH